MAVINYDTREIYCKIIYFGAPGAGKTSNLLSIFRKTSPDVRAGLFDIENTDSPGLFEFLPLSLGYLRDYHLRLHLYTMGNFDFMPSVQETLLRGVDGYVFVVDAQMSRFAHNIDYLEQAQRGLIEAGYNLAELPRVVQYNKMDLDKLVPLKVLKAEMNASGGIDCVSVATTSEGTLETLKMITQQVLRQVGHEFQDSSLLMEQSLGL